MNETDSKNKNQFNFVYQSGQKLNKVRNRRSSSFLRKLRGKWTGAAVIALASSSFLLFSTHNVKADMQKPNDDQQQPDPIIQKTSQNLGRTPQLVSRKDDAVPSDAFKQNLNNKLNSQNNQQGSQDNSISNLSNKNTNLTTNNVVKSEATQKDSNQESSVDKGQNSQSSQVASTKNATDISDNSNTSQSITSSSVNDSQNKNNPQDGYGEKDANGVQLPDTYHDHLKGNVEGAWKQGYKGEHTVVAVIDSGVDYTHKDFLTMPKDPKLTANQMKRLIEKLGYGRYVNEKFPYVYNYVDNTDDNMLPPDYEPHGTHVSGIVAADGHPNGDKQYIVGVAPEAQLMQLKVFGDHSTDLNMAKAIYDAVNLGADVINLSWGGGVPGSDINIIEQRAVQYAINHGVVVVISTGNSGNSASVDDSSNVKDAADTNYTPGSDSGNFEPVNSSTVSSPAAYLGAISVAAEQPNTGKLSNMAFFSSWGPLPDYTLKPDISAPGYFVMSTSNHNGYMQMSGTSMAAPYVSGATALVLEKLHRTNPKLKGAALVQAVKALLMNTANPMTQYKMTNLVSPRFEGAGQINVGAATSSPVYITSDNGTGAVSLKRIGNSTSFVLTLHNLTNQAEEFSFDDYGGGYTEVRNKDTGKFSDVQLAGARVVGNNIVTLKPNEVKKITYTLNLTNLKHNQLVEGYLRFTNTKDKSTLVVPYLGYYGDLTDEDIFDQNANDPVHDLGGDRFVNEDNYPRGIADEDSLKELIDIGGNYNWQQVAKLYESGKVAFSPNGDHKSDLIRPYAYIKQNLKDLKVEIIDGSGRVVRVLTDSHGVDKSYHSDGGGTVDLTYGAANPDAFDWDGKLYDVKTGKMITAPDGNYTYRFIATLVNKGAKQVPTNDTPVIIDTTAPVVENVRYNRRTHTISGNYSDKGAGFTDYSYGTITINDRVFGFKLADGKNSTFDNAAKTKGHFSFKLTSDELAALSSADNLVSVAFSDVADNTSVKSIKVDGSYDEPGVTIWNATNGLPFSKSSVDYDAKDDIYNLRGNAADDFYVNGKLVQVDDNSNFVFPVKADANQDFIFSSDVAGKDILKKFKNYTLKAEFHWQEVDGAIGKDFPTFFEIKENDPNDIIVQAAVPKDDNVKAFAEDYSTGLLYQGVVKDGVATFHVHLTQVKDPKTGIYQHAYLYGWAEIDGPLFYQKQVTDQDALDYDMFISLVYDKNAKPQHYTSRDQLKTNVTDEPVDYSIFVPGNYPGHNAPSAHNPDIKFDYLDDNNQNNLGADVIKKGYYNPRTHQFTLTGQLDDKVISLTFLANSPYEEAAENQADISNNGKFSVSFKIPPTGSRELSYLYMTNDGKVTRGSLTIVLDTVLPTLEVDQMSPKRNEIEYTTNNPNFVLSGVANDNVDGYAVMIDGDNVFTQYSNSGYDFIPNLYNKGQKTPNTYGPYRFKVNEALDDENGKPTTHVFTIDVIDFVGNKVEKKIIVHYDPKFKADNNQEKTPSSVNTKASQLTQATKPVQPSVPALVAVQPTKTAQPTKPAAPTKPWAQQSSPVQPTKLVQLTEPATSTQPKQQTIPAQINKTDNNQQATPTQSVKPAVKGQVTNTKKADQNKNQGQVSEKSNQVQPVVPAVPTQVVPKSNTNSALSKLSNQSNAALDNGSQSVASSADPEGQSTPVANTSVVVTTPVKAQKVAVQRRITLYRGAYAYNSKGKLLRKAGKLVLYKKGRVFVLKNEAKIVKIKGQAYYQVGKNTYIKVSATLKGKLPLRRIDVYGKEGRKKGRLTVNTNLKLLNRGKVTLIHGQRFYQIGKNRFVKVADLRE